MPSVFAATTSPFGYSSYSYFYGIQYSNSHS